MEAKVRILVGALVLVAGLTAVVLLARSGGDDGGGSDDAAAVVEERGKPAVEVPDGPPPERLQIEDLVEGDGAEAQSGDQVTVHYVGVDYRTGKQFDASWDRGDPFPFRLGAGEVIPGWDQGVEGMKVGGRRRLTIPPDLAYGEQGQPPTIRPNATLVFVVDLVAIR